MHLVVGATGLLGSWICSLLAEKNRPVRALCRSSADQIKVNNLKELGIEIVRGDLQSRSSLDYACAGVNTIISTASSLLSGETGDSIDAVDLKGHINLIEAAKTANVNCFVFISFPKADIDFPLQTAKRRVEDYLQSSGLKYIILQPAMFMEVWLSPALGFDVSSAKARIYGSGENKISWISYKDVGKFAVSPIENLEARNSVIKLGGPEDLSPLQVVNIFERTSGKIFDLEFIPEEKLKLQYESSTNSIQQSFAGLMLYYAQGSIASMQETPQDRKIRYTSIKDFAESACKNAAQA